MYANPDLSPEEAAAVWVKHTAASVAAKEAEKAKPTEEKTIASVQAELTKMKYELQGVKAELQRELTKNETITEELRETTQKLHVMSGVTFAQRDTETLKKLQKADNIQRNDIWCLESQLSAQREEIRQLRAALGPTESSMYPTVEWQKMTAPTIGDVMDKLGDPAPEQGPTAGSLGLCG